MSPRHWKLLAAVAVAACVAACGSTEQAGQAMRSSWIGKKSADFFAQHGAAKREQVLSDGRRAYIWEANANASMGGPQVLCSADIIVTQSGTISDIRPREDSIGLWNTSRCSEIFR